MNQLLLNSLDELRNIATALGISTDGKSAKDLSALIKGVAHKPPARSPSSTDPWGALPKHFEEGRFTDCCILVKISDASGVAPADRPAKRLRSGRRKATETEGPADETQGVHVIKDHAVILASRSPYFERAMGGEWRESKDKSLEVEVADEQEFVTFRRLIKLCYGSTFIKDGDRDLDFSELVRLIHVANAFECIDAVKQCTAAIQGTELDREGAVQCIELADMLKDVEGMEGLAEKAGSVIAKEVGFVHKLFTPVDDEDDGGDVLGGLRLSEKVKDMSPAIFEALVSSEDLQLKTENEAFWLLLAWVEAQSDETEEGKQELFTRMAKHLSFDAMDPGYIVLLVSEHPRIIAAGLQHEAIRASLIRSNLARRTAEEVSHLKADYHYELPSGRAPPGQVSWTKGVTFTTTDIAGVTMDTGCMKKVGLVAGTPWIVTLYRETDDKNAAEPDEAWVGTGCTPPCEWDSSSLGMGPTGFFFWYRLKAGAERSITTPLQSVYTGPTMLSGTVAGWEEVFREGSEWLREGQLDVTATVLTRNDQ